MLRSLENVHDLVGAQAFSSLLGHHPILCTQAQDAGAEARHSLRVEYAMSSVTTALPQANNI